MSETDVIRAVVNALNQYVSKSDLPYLADNFSYMNPVTGPTDTQGWTAFHGGLFQAFLDIHFRLDYMVESDGLIATEYTVTGTNQSEFMRIPPANRTVEMPVSFWTEVSNDKITTWHSYLHTGTMMRQLGAQ